MKSLGKIWKMLFLLTVVLTEMQMRCIWCEFGVRTEMLESVREAATILISCHKSTQPKSMQSLGWNLTVKHSFTSRPQRYRTVYNVIRKYWRPKVTDLEHKCTEYGQWINQGLLTPLRLCRRAFNTASGLPVFMLVTVGPRLLFWAKILD